MTMHYCIATLLFWTAILASHAASFRVPSTGAMVLESDLIVVGSISQSGTNAEMRVDECIVGAVEKGKTLNVASFGMNPFLTSSKVVELLNGDKYLVMGRKCSNGSVILHGVNSILPTDGRGSAYLADVRSAKMFVEKILNYKRIFADDEDRLMTQMLEDLSYPIGRVAAIAFLSEDVGVWRGKEYLRRGIACAVGNQLLKMNVRDADTVNFFLTGMPSLPVSLRLSYLYKIMEEGGENCGSCKKTLHLLLKTMGSDCNDLLPVAVNECINKGVVCDMKNALRLLSTDSSERQKCARIVLSSVSGRPVPQNKTLDEEVMYWLGVIDELVAMRELQ